jgi:hypothetical protein
MKRVSPLIIFLLLLLLHKAVAAPSSLSQNPAALLQQYQKEYPGEPGLFLEQRTEVQISARAGAVQVQATHFYDMLHLSEQSNGYAQEVLHANSFTRLLNIDAYSLVPNNSRYKKVKVEQFEEKDNVSSGFIFYDDTRLTRFVFPGARPGTRNVLNYTQSFTEPRFLTPWYPGSALSVEKAELKIITDAQVHLNFKVFHAEGLDLKFEMQETGGKKIYRWSAANLKGYRSFEEGAPEAPHHIPHLIYWVERVDQATAASGLATPADLYNFYTSFIKDLKPEGNAALQATVDSLVHSAKTDEEKVRRIFYWVQDHIKYIAFEDGMRGFVPHGATRVFNNRYGDCKDMSSITWTMLRMAGVQEAHLAWIGTRRLPYRYEEVPTPIVDNHMIAVYKNPAGTWVYLDATNQHSQYGLPSSMIQGKQALIALSDEKFELAEVPVISASHNTRIDSLQLRIENKGLQGSGRLLLKGYPKTFTTYQLEGTSRQEERERVKKMLTKGHNKFFLGEYSIANVYERDAPLQIDYSFGLEDYHRQLGNELYINLHLERDFEHSKIDLQKRRQPIEREFHYDETQLVRLEIPKGYRLQYLPPSQEHNHPLFGFEFRYRQQGTVVVLEKKLRISHLMLQKENFEHWNQMVALLQSAYREVVILEK